MKVFCEIVVGSDELPPEKFAALRANFPHQGPGEFVFRSKRPLEDPTNDRIRAFLREAGMTEPTNTLHKYPKGQMRLQYSREYEQADYEAAEYLEPWPKNIVAYYTERSKTGILRIRTGYMRHFRLAQAGSEIVVTEDFREVLEKAALKHLRFQKTVIFGEGAENYTQKIWEVTSDLTMPPLSPTCRLCSCYGEPVGDPKDGLSIDDGLYLPVEYHYTRSSLKDLGVFDAARVREGTGPFFRYHHLIVSQRFYQFCLKQKLKMPWKPVRIDPD